MGNLKRHSEFLFGVLDRTLVRKASLSFPWSIPSLKLLETEGHRSCWNSKNNKDLQSEKILEMQLYPILHVTRWAWLTSAQKSFRQDGNWNHPSRFPCQSPHGSLVLPSSHLGSVHAPSSGSQLGIYRSGCQHIVSAECLCADNFLQNSYFGSLPVDKSCGRVWNGKKGLCCIRSSTQILSFLSRFWAKPSISHNHQQSTIT